MNSSLQALIVFLRDSSKLLVFYCLLEQLYTSGDDFDTSIVMLLFALIHYYQTLTWGPPICQALLDIATVLEVVGNDLLNLIGL